MMNAEQIEAPNCIGIDCGELQLCESQIATEDVNLEVEFIENL